MSFFKKATINSLEENSILTAKNIVVWKRNQGVYNFEKLPKTVILTPKSNFINGFKKITTKRIKGISGKSYLLNNNYLLSYSFGNGAPALVTHLEELQELGVNNFIFIGFAGMLNANLKENNSYIISKAFSATGTSYFYHKNENVEYKNELHQKIKSTLSLEEKKVMSTDAPFRETASIINNYISKGCDLIDMETAAILAFSKFYNLNCACILLASDRIQDANWNPPKSMKTLSDKMDDIIRKLLKM